MSVMVQMKRQISAKLSNGSFKGLDLSDLDLSGANLSHSIFDGCNFDRANLSEANCSFCDFRNSSMKRTNCFKTNFMCSVFPAVDYDPSDCYGMTVTLTCKLWENTHVGQLWFYMWLMLGASMRPVKLPVSEDLREALISFIGQERYIKLRDLLSRRNF